MKSYVLLTTLLALTPGATTAVVVQHAVRGGLRSGLLAAFGAAGGNSTHALATALGLAAVISTWPRAQIGLRIAGGVYLCYLGARSIQRAWIGWRAPARAPQANDRTEPVAAVREGLTVTLLNPSIATFYLTVVPGFVAPSSGVGGFLLLGAIHITIAFCCHSTWAALVSTFRAHTSPRRLAVLDAVTGVVLIVIGIRQGIA